MIDERQSTIIRGGNEPNRIELRCVGNLVAIVLNDTAVESIQDDTFSRGVFSIGAYAPGSRVDAWFDDLVVWASPASSSRVTNVAPRLPSPRVSAPTPSPASAQARTSQSRVWAWGDNDEGELGGSSEAYSRTPVEVMGLSETRFVASGGSHGLALSSNGSVWAWGQNARGQLGNGSIGPGPSDAGQVNGLTDVTAIAGGIQHSVALKADGTVWSWGSSRHFDLAARNARPEPEQVAGLSQITSIAPGGSGLAGIPSRGSSFSLAVRSDGTLWSWGEYNNATGGPLVNGPFVRNGVAVLVPGLVHITSAATGWSHGLALEGDGTVWAFGSNGMGQLGNGSLTNSGFPTRVAVLTGVTAVSAGGRHSLAVKSDGTLWAWGENTHGQLGAGDITFSNIPLQVPGMNAIVAVAAGGSHSLALKGDGTVWAWGRNHLGQLGTGTVADSSVPLQVAGLTGITGIAAGHHHSFANR